MNMGKTTTDVLSTCNCISGEIKIEKTYHSPSFAPAAAARHPGSQGPILDLCGVTPTTWRSV